MPAAAVIRRVQALIGITGRKGCVGGLIKLSVKSLGLTWAGQIRLLNSSMGEGSGISGVAVKCVEIGRNTSGEGGYLA